MPSISEASLIVRDNATDIQVVASHKNLVKNRQASVVQGIAKVVSAQSFIIMTADVSSQQVLIK